jgi:hypothetical protein
LLAGCLGPSLLLPDPNAATQNDAPRDNSAEPARPARAFQVARSADLIEGPVSDGQVGDYRLDNDRIAVIISAPSRAIGFAESGGNLVDAAPLDGHDSLKQLFGYLGDSFPRQPLYERITARQLGRDAAIIVSGHDSQDPGIAIETEYRLAPGSNAVAITSTISNGSHQELTRFALGDALEWGRSQRFVPEHGLQAFGRIVTEAGYVLAFASDAAYAYVLAEGALDGRHGWAWSDFNDLTVDLPPGGSVRLTRYLAVGAPTDAVIDETIASLRKEHWARLIGRVLEEGTSEPVPGARVFFDDLDGRPIALTRSTVHGYEIGLPAGEYHLRADALGRRGPERLDVSVGETAGATHDLILSRRSALAFTVRSDGDLLPAKLRVLGIPPTRDPDLGPRFANPGGNVVLTADGTGELPLAPGSYRVIASRGPEYTIDDERVDIKGGETAHVGFTLARAIDAFGMRCVDLHQHTQLSSDAAVATTDRALTNLAEGLDLMVATDHNEIAADWKSAIEGLHATRPLEVIVGDEATVEGVGHFAAFPLVAQPTEPRGGAPDVRHRPADELLRAIKGPDRVVVLEHPRAGRTGYFENIGLDERMALPKDFAGGFDALEIFSGKDTTRVEPALRDWLMLLDHGLTYTAVGGSDSHLVAGQEVGYPRTCFVPDKADANAAAALLNALKRSRNVIVTNGPFINISVAGKGAGQLAPVKNGKAKLDVEIEAAPWIDVRHLEVFVNGSRRGKPIDVPASQKAQRFDGSIELRIDRDAYVVAIVRGDAPLGPVVPADEGQPPPTPLAITNPIYLDRDGDNRFTPSSPLLKSEALPAPAKTPPSKAPPHTKPQSRVQ